MAANLQDDDRQDDLTSATAASGAMRPKPPEAEMPTDFPPAYRLDHVTIRFLGTVIPTLLFGLLIAYVMM